MEFTQNQTNVTLFELFTSIELILHALYACVMIIIEGLTFFNFDHLWLHFNGSLQHDIRAISNYFFVEQIIWEQKRIIRYYKYVFAADRMNRY